MKYTDTIKPYKLRLTSSRLSANYSDNHLQIINEWVTEKIHNFLEVSGNRITELLCNDIDFNRNFQITDKGVLLRYHFSSQEYRDALNDMEASISVVRSVLSGVVIQNYSELYKRGIPKRCFINRGKYLKINN